MSMNKSMSTSSYDTIRDVTTSKIGCLEYLDALFLGDMPSRLIPTMTEDPIHYPPVQAGVNPSNVLKIFGALDILDDGKVFTSLVHDIQRR